MKNRSLLFVGTCMMALSMAQPAAAQSSENADAAQEDSDGGLNVIVVTAQKRDQNLQDVGLSVTAVAGEEITARNISNSIDLIRSVPSIDNYSTYGPGSNANIVVRGVGLNDFGEGHEAPVTVYVDEVYQLSVASVDFALFDLERAEVLRGPQGTLFGRNSTGGLVHYVTRKPGDVLEGYAKISAARFDEVKAEGAISFPITTNLSGRVSFVSHHSDGYIRNLNPDFENGAQAGTDAIRGQLRYQDDGWDAVLKVEYGEQDRVHTYYESTPTIVDPATGLASLDPTGVDDAGYNEVNFGAGDRNVTFTNAPQFLRSDGLLISLRVDKDISDDVVLTSVTSYSELNRNLAEDCDASPNDICAANFPYEGETFTQELRFTGDSDRVRWQAGLYGLHAKGRNNPSAIFNAPVGGPTAVDPVTGLYNGGFLPIALAANWRLKTVSGSVFGQVEYDLSDSLTVIAGARVTHDSKDFDDADNASLRSCPGYPIPTNCPLPPAGPGIANPFSGDYDQTLFSGRLQLNYTPTDDLLFFASVSRGTKAGGFNNGFAPGGVQPAQIPYGDETLHAFEIGQKATLADGRVRLNSSAFYYVYDDFQTFNWEGIGGLIVNRDAENYGAEIELEASPIDNLNIRIAGSYLNTKIKGVTLPAGISVNREAANAPKWTANGAIDYTIPLNDDAAELRLNWNWNYRSSRFANNFNDPSVLLEGYFQHNADITLQVNENFYVQGFVRNISNEISTTKAFQFSFLGYAQQIFSEPRVFGGAVGFNF